MKKLLCLLLTVGMLLSLLPAQALAVDAPGDISLFVAQNDAADLHGKVTVALKKSDGQYSGTVYLPGGADAAGLRLFFTGAEEVKVDGKAYPSGLAPIPAPGKSLSYTLSGGSFTLKTMQGSEGVAALFLEVDESRGTISAMNRDRNKNTECFGSLNMDGQTHFMSMKGRGNSTWTNFDKKPYNITVFSDAECTVKETVKFIEGVKSKKWSLIANAKDSTLLRNRLALYMANELGIGLETRFVDVWLNGEYRGNYLMTPKNDYQAPENGYMLEIDNAAGAGDETFSVRGFNGSRAPSFTVKDNGAGVSTSEIKAYIQETVTAILDKSSTKFLDYIDVESWAKMCLLQEFYKNTDVVSGSLFLYRNGLAPEDKIFGGPVWDLDVAMGRGWPKSVTTVENEAQVSGGKWYIDNIQTDAWYQVLCQHPEITSRMYELYNEYRDVFDSVPEFVAKENAAIQDSADMNFDFWDVNRDKDHNPYTCEAPVSYGSGDYQVNFIAADDRDDYLTNFNEYINKRLLFLSDYLGVETPVGTITGNLNPQNGEKLTLTAALTAGKDNPTYQWQSAAYGGEFEDIPGATEETYSVKATPELTGTAIRCRVRNNGELIETQKIAKVNAGAGAYLEPVTIAVDIGPHTHSYREAVTPPTCTEAGFTTYTCTLCGEITIGNETPALDHDIVDGSCSRCGMKPYRADFRAGHASVTVYASQHEDCAPQENPAFAYARDGDTGIISADGGQVNFTVTPEAGYRVVSVTAAPTENYKNLKLPAETGTGYRVTKVAGDLTITVVTESVSCQHEFADGACIHCGEKAYRADFICDDHCTVTVYDTQALEHGAEKADHAFAKNGETGEIDLSGDGQVSFVVVPDPGYETATVTAAPANYKNLKTPAETLVPDYYRITKVTGDITVTVTTRKSVCEHTYVTIVTPPTCTEKGFTTYTCSKCGERYVADETAEIPHKFENGECTYCHSKLFAVHFAADHAIVTVYESQAEDSPYVVNPAVAYARNGDTGLYDISGDGQVNFTVAPEDGYAIVSVTAAPKASYKNLKRPEETGTGYRVTKVAGDVVITVTTEKTECQHSYAAVVTAPTCTEEGYTTYTCAKCGDSYKGSETAALGHELKETRTEATCTQAGSVTKSCTRCDYQQVTALPALGHDYKAAVTAPTCTERGYTTYTCTRCGDSYQGSETAALGHDLEETRVEATCTTGGKVIRECTRCDYSEVTEIPAPGHDYVNGECIHCGAKDTAYPCDGGETCPSKLFPDSPKPGTWSHAGIDYCVKTGLMKGVSDGIFKPNGTVTRGQLVTILYRIAGEDELTTEKSFSDVADGRYYTKAVLWAAENEIVTGYADGTFLPNREITREQIATILYRCAGKPEVKGTLDFPDAASVGSYAGDAMLWATQQGLITGISSGGVTTLSPKSSATRAQIATIIMRYLAA